LNSLLLGRNLQYHSSLSVQSYEDYMETISLTSVAAVGNYNNVSLILPCALLKEILYTSRSHDYQILTLSKLNTLNFHKLLKPIQAISKHTMILSFRMHSITSNENKC